MVNQFDWSVLIRRLRRLFDKTNSVPVTSILMFPAKWLASLLGVGLCCCGIGCGHATSSAAFKPATLTATTPAATVRVIESRRWDNGSQAERLSHVRKLAVAGPDAEGVTKTLVEALDDEDKEVKKVAAVALLSFGEKSLEPLRKKLPPEDTAPLKIPNPKKAPIEFLSLPDLIVARDPWFAGTIYAAAEELAQDQVPALRIVGVRALLVGAGSREDRVRAALELAVKDPDEKVRAAANETLKRLDDAAAPRK
jgi:HEAT repeat protein